MRERGRNTYTRVQAHTRTHTEVDRLTHRHMTIQLGPKHTECRTLGGREGRCWGTEARVRSPLRMGVGVPTTLPCPKHLPPGPWQESSPLSAACNTSAWSLLSSLMKRCGRVSSHLAGGFDSWQARVVSALDHCVQQGPHLWKDMRSQSELSVSAPEQDGVCLETLTAQPRARTRPFNLVNPLINSLPGGQPSILGHGPPPQGPCWITFPLTTPYTHKKHQTDRQSEELTLPRHLRKWLICVFQNVL